jgi:hypothetical protein
LVWRVVGGGGGKGREMMDDEEVWVGEEGEMMAEERVDKGNGDFLQRERCWVGVVIGWFGKRIGRKMR